MKRLSNLGTSVTIRGGKCLTTTGGREVEAFLVFSGTATCFVRDVEVARFGRGDFFGEVATLDGGPRTATVVADTDMELLVFDKFEFENLVRASPEVAHRILRVMATRLRQANAMAVAVDEWKSQRVHSAALPIPQAGCACLQTMLPLTEWNQAV